MMGTSSSTVGPNSNHLYARSSPIITISTVNSNGRRQIHTIPLVIENGNRDNTLFSLDLLENDLLEQLFRNAAAAASPTTSRGGSSNRHHHHHHHHYPNIVTRNLHFDSSKATNGKQLAELPTIICDPSDPYQKQFGDCDKECTVCLCEAQPRDRLLILPCQHSFHESCLKPWLKDHNSCPTCRYELEMADSGLERNRKLRMKREYGEEAIKLMQLCSQVQRVYCDLQGMSSSSTNSSSSSSLGGGAGTGGGGAAISGSRPRSKSRDQRKNISQLNSMESSLAHCSRQLKSLKIPSAASSGGQDEISEKKYTWDWNRVRLVQQQYLQRINVLQDRIDSYREQLNSSRKNQCCAIC